MLTFSKDHYCTSRGIFAGLDRNGEPLFLRDIWPSRKEIEEVERQHELPAMFMKVYSSIQVSNMEHLFHSSFQFSFFFDKNCFCLIDLQTNADNSG